MDRASRVGEEIRNNLSDIIRNKLRDPRIPPITSITEVRVSRDLSHANVYVSVYGEEEEKEACLAALKGSAGFARRELSGRMKLRIMPELHFILDESIERGIRISNLIDKTIKEDEERNDSLNRND